MAGIKGKGISKPTINVYGISGCFSVAKFDESSTPIRVRYFSTNASNNSTSESGNSLALLREL